MKYFFNKIILAILITLFLFNGLIAQDFRKEKSANFKLYSGSRHPQIKKRFMTVQVGDSTKENSEPAFNIDLWQGECNLKVSLRNNLTPFETAVLPEVSNSANLIARYVDSSDVFYRMFKRADGNFEWEIILKKIPPVCQFSYNIQTRGLSFYYQPPLSGSELDSLWLKVSDSDSILVPKTIRPDSVVGSYAVYHNSRANNYHRLDGSSEIYKTGKAFHIYRPKAWDSAGDTVWGELFIDTTANLLTVTVDSLWLLKAVYPVTIDPTFGHTSIGGTGSSPGEYNLIALYDDFVTTGAATADTGYIYTWKTAPAESPDVNIYVYERTGTLANDDWIDSLSTRIAIHNLVPAWLNTSMNQSNNLESGVAYIAAFQAIDNYSTGSMLNFKYDIMTGGVVQLNDTDMIPPSTLSGGTTTLTRYSCYVVYSEEAGSVKSNKRRILLSGANK